MNSSLIRLVTASRILSLQLMLCICLTVSAGAQGEKYGVGFVPHMNAGDKAEQMIHRFVGEMPEIDHMFNINDGLHMLQTLVKLKNQGKKLDFLVVGGHGSRDNPAIGWATHDMMPEEIDLEWNKAQLEKTKIRRAKAIGTQTKVLDELIKEGTERVKLLEQMPGVMNPNAVVLLINCSPAATPRGQMFIKKFGNLLMGKYGGEIIASKNDVTLREIEDLYDRFGALFAQGENMEWGSTLVDANWVNFVVPRWEIPGAMGKQSKPSGPITTAKVNPARSFTGTWKTDYGTLKLTQSGSSVGGESDYYSTKVEGKIKEDGKLYYSWNDSNKKKGVGVFELSSDGNSFSGSWNYLLSDGKTLGLGGGWGGTRVN